MYTCRSFFDAATYRSEYYFSLLQEKGVKLAGFFEENNYSNIAIYGLNSIGKRLYEDLNSSGTSVKVKYFIDKYKKGQYKDVEIINLKNPEIENMDAIIVAPVLSFNQIVSELLNQKISIDKILHIDDVIFNLVWRYF